MVKLNHKVDSNLGIIEESNENLDRLEVMEIDKFSDYIMKRLTNCSTMKDKLPENIRTKEATIEGFKTFERRSTNIVKASESII